MIKKIAFLVFLGATGFWPTAAFSEGIPVPPAGYSWANCEETKSAFLKPDGWFFRKQKMDDDEWGYYISKEDTAKAETGKFRIGLSVYVIPDIPGKKGMSAPDAALEIIKMAAENRLIVKEQWSNESLPFKGFGVVVRTKDPKEEDTFFYNLAIGNETTGTLYLLTFEGPFAKWTEAMNPGEIMLQHFLIDNNF